MGVIQSTVRNEPNQTCRLHPRERRASLVREEPVVIPAKQQTTYEVSMTQTLTAEERQIDNTVEFRRAFGTLHQAAVGVVMVRTREPFRVAEILRAFAHAERDSTGAALDFRQWDTTRGWERPDPSDPLESTSDNEQSVVKALGAIGGAQGSGGFGNGIFVLHYPQFFMNMPQMIYGIKRYAREFPDDKRRLVLTVPVGYALPAELRDDVVVIDFDTPSYKELHDTYGRIIGDLPDKKQPRFSPEQVDTLLANGAGMTLHEFETAVARALVENRKDLPNVNFDKVAQAVMRVKTEAVKRTEVLEVMKAEDMSNIGGLEALKSWVRKRKRCFTQEARDFGVEPPKGIMLAGPPGTGKSLSAKAIASELGIPLIKFDVSRVFASLVGQSEERVEQALKMVENMAPAVLMIDEVDKALGGIQSGGGDSGVGKRVLGKILTWLQEHGKPIFTVVSANRVADLPSELLRRGRLDEIFSVSVPNADERRAVLEIHLRKRGHDPEAEGIDLDAAVDGSENYVPAEIEAAVKDALVEAFDASEPITGRLIAEQLEFMVPLSEAFADDFNAMKIWAEQNARPANGSADAGASPARARVRTRTQTRKRVSSGQRDIALDG